MILTALVFFGILSLLVFIHELGHFMVARWVGVRVDEFGFGLPPRIWGKKIRETIYSINALPIGGFVRLAGEDASDAEEQKERHTYSKKELRQFFWARSKKERSFILLAGVTMNFILAVFLTGILVTRGIIEPSGYVHIETVVQGSPAESAGLKEKDIVRTVTVMESNQPKMIIPVKPEDLISTVKKHSGEQVLLTIERLGERIDVAVIPRINPPKGQGALGIAVSDLERKTYAWYQIPVKSIEITFSRSWQMVSSIGNLLYRLVTGAKVESTEVSGPIGIAQVTGQAMQYGWEAVIEFMSILSLNLAVLNILPFPALDGGRLLFVFLEKLGRKARPNVERVIHQVGMMILLALIVVITINDILRIIRG